MEKGPNNSELESSLKLIVKTSLIVFAGAVLSKVFTYAYKIIIARQLGPEVYGMFSLAGMILELFAIFSSLGLAEGLLRYVSIYRGIGKQNKIRHILRVSLIISFFSSIILGSSLFFLSGFISINIFHNPPLAVFLRWFSFLIPVSVFLNIFLSLIRAYEKISTHSFIKNIMQPFLNLVILILFILLGFKSSAVIGSYAGGLVLSLLISFWLCKYKISKAFAQAVLSSKDKKKAIRDLFSYSWPLIFLSVFSNLLVWIDSFMIGYLMNVSDVGFYNVSTTFANLFNLVPLIITALFYPLVVKEFSKNRTQLIKNLSHQITKWIFTLNLPVLILFILFPGAIINLFFGAEYLVAENSLRILSAGGFVFSVLILSRDLVSMQGKSKTLLVDILIVSLANFLLNLKLIPYFGINGSAFSTSVSLIVLGVILTFQSKNYLSLTSISKKIGRVFIASLIPTLMLIFSKQVFPKSFLSIVFQGLIFILVYFLLVFLTGSLDKQDMAIIHTIIRKFLRKN